MRETDLGRCSSPYAQGTSADNINESTFCVHRKILEAAPSLSAESRKLSHALFKSVSLPYYIGHVIVHFLYTGKYQDLPPEGISEDTKALHLETAIGVYKTSRKYELLQLEELSKSRIKSLCDPSNLPVLVDVLEATYSSYGQDDKWLPAFIASQLQGFCESLGPETAVEHEQNISDSTSRTLVRIILHHMVTLQQEIVAGRNRHLMLGSLPPGNHSDGDALNGAGAQAEPSSGEIDLCVSNTETWVRLGSNEEKEWVSELPAPGCGDEEEERELEQLVAKKARRGKLSKSADRQRYHKLMELAKARAKQAVDEE